MAKCINCKYYIFDQFCEPYKEKDYDFEIDGIYKEHDCPNFKEKCSCYKLGKSLNSGMKCSNCGREL